MAATPAPIPPENTTSPLAPITLQDDRMRVRVGMALIVGFFLMLIVWSVLPPKLPGEMTGGVIVAGINWIGWIVSYWFGSSSGSAFKTRVMETVFGKRE